MAIVNAISKLRAQIEERTGTLAEIRADMGKVELQMKKARESLEAKAKTDNMASEVQTSSYGALLAKERERPHCEWRFIFDPRPLPPVRWFWRNHRTDLHHLLLLHSHHHRTSPVAHPSTTTRRRAHQPVLSLRLSSGHLLRGRMTEPVFYGRTGRLRRDCGQEISDSIGMGKWGYSTTRIWSHRLHQRPTGEGTLIKQNRVFFWARLSDAYVLAGEYSYQFYKEAWRAGRIPKKKKQYVEEVHPWAVPIAKGGTLFTAVPHEELPIPDTMIPDENVFMFEESAHPSTYTVEVRAHLWRTNRRELVIEYANLLIRDADEMWIMAMTDLLATFLNTISYPAADPEEIVDLTSIVNAIAKLRIDVENQTRTLAEIRTDMDIVEINMKKARSILEAKANKYETEKTE
ncbi:hypothetical protein IWZ01DRAFT_529793 [Phyllosticta capitalensis]